MVLWPAYTVHDVVEWVGLYDEHEISVTLDPRLSSTTLLYLDLGAT